MQRLTTQGVAIPRLGFGTFRMLGTDAQPVVESAIALGHPSQCQQLPLQLGST
jgi:2,5-diketo-D-gluconate reductase B